MIKLLKINYLASPDALLSSSASTSILCECLCVYIFVFVLFCSIFYLCFVFMFMCVLFFFLCIYTSEYILRLNMMSGHIMIMKACQHLVEVLRLYDSKEGCEIENIYDNGI